MKLIDSFSLTQLSPPHIFKALSHMSAQVFKLRCGSKIEVFPFYFSSSFWVQSLARRLMNVVMWSSGCLLDLRATINVLIIAICKPYGR